MYFLYKTNRFHFAVVCSVIDAQMTSQRGENIFGGHFFVHTTLSLVRPSVHALTCTGLETFSSRRHSSCVKFISKLRWEAVLDYNPLAHIARTQPQYFDHNYYLRTTNYIRYVIRLILTLYRVLQFNTAIRVIKQIIIIIIIFYFFIIIIITEQTTAKWNLFVKWLIVNHK